MLIILDWETFFLLPTRCEGKGKGGHGNDKSPKGGNPIGYTPGTPSVAHHWTYPPGRKGTLASQCLGVSLGPFAMATHIPAPYPFMGCRAE